MENGKWIMENSRIVFSVFHFLAFAEQPENENKNNDCRNQTTAQLPSGESG